MLCDCLFYTTIVLFRASTLVKNWHKLPHIIVPMFFKFINTTVECTYRRMLNNKRSVKVACIERPTKRRADVINVRRTQGCHSKWYPVIIVTYFMDQICLASHVFLFMFARRAFLLRLYLLSCSLCAVVQFLFPLFCYP